MVLFSARSASVANDELPTFELLPASNGPGAPAASCANSSVACTTVARGCKTGKWLVYMHAVLWELTTLTAAKCSRTSMLMSEDRIHSVHAIAQSAARQGKARLLHMSATTAAAGVVLTTTAHFPTLLLIPLGRPNVCKPPQGCNQGGDCGDHQLWHSAA